ncbi:MAG: hypothetical protein CMD14_00060 [Flavobacteriales bacterium]|nr:hypothetical protein [Flavobacteriales bacterium]|tara:strand:- start:16967 stop:17896 length:930 start_codon:yes stop_codon:yes gene_type:complete
MKFIKQVLFFLFIIVQFKSYSQSTWVRLELDVKQMLNPSCNLNMGDVNSNKVYAHLGLCTCNEQSPFGPENRDCNDQSANELFCTTQITPFQSRVWQHVVGNWGSTPQDDGVGLMTYEGDSIWSMEFIIEDYFSDLTLVQDTSMGNDSSVAYQNGLIPYTIGVVFRDKDGFYSGRDNGCNDIFITGLKNGYPQVIQSVDLSTYEALTVQTTTLGLDEIKDIRNVQVYPNPSSGPVFIRFTLQNYEQDLQLNLYDLQGKLVFQLYEGEMKSGNHEIRWDGEVKGDKLSASKYVLEIKGKSHHIMQSIIVN